MLNGYSRHRAPLLTRGPQRCNCQAEIAHVGEEAKKDPRSICHSSLLICYSPIEIDKTTPTTSPSCGLVARKDLSPFKNDADKSSFPSHPFLLVKAHETGCGRIYRMVSAHFYLTELSVSRFLEVRANTHVGPRME